MSGKTSVEVVNEKPRRHSHQPTANPVPNPKVKRNNSLKVEGLSQNVRRASSIEKSRRTVQQSNLKKPSVPDIQEVEQNEDDEAVTPRLEKTDNALRVSYTKNNRKISSASKNSSNRLNAGYANEAYDHSNGSSIQGSMASLPVIREQYCCCKKWTRMEKILLAVVAFMAFVIVCLVIAVGVTGGTRASTSNAPDAWFHFNF